MKQYEIEFYTQDDGEVPFQEWLDAIRDKRARANITARLSRAAMGNFGDWKALKGAEGVFEMRIHYSPGYRIYYHLAGQKLVVILAGSTKREQDKAIESAKTYLTAYKERLT